MKDHSEVLDYTKQVIDLQAQLGIGIEARQRINICGTNYVVDAGVADYLAGMADEVERLRDKLLERETWVAQRDAEIDELQNQIIEADSAYNIDGHTSFMAETASLVRLCHEGAAALHEVARLRDGLRAVGVIVAGLSMTDVNFGRAELARVEGYIDGVLERGAI